MTRFVWHTETSNSPSGSTLSAWRMYCEWLWDPNPWPNPFEPFTETYYYGDV